MAEHIFDIPNKALSTEKFRVETGWDLYTLDGNKLAISGDCTEAQAKTALDAHDGNMPELSVQQKLAIVGLSIDDLKAALGL